jgi:hypothetical protein
MEKSHDEQLRKLLRLKSCECPDEAFWRSFDAEFQSRRLSIIIKKPIGQRMLRFFKIVFRPALAVFFVACVACSLYFCPGDPVRTLDKGYPREYFSLTVANPTNDCVLINEKFDSCVNDFCYVAALHVVEGKQLLTAYNF